MLTRMHGVGDHGPDMRQVQAELLGEHNVDQHAYTRIVGAKRDTATGQVQVAVVWEDNTLHPTGGSWEPIENIGNILQELPTPSESGYESGESKVAEAAQQCEQWQKNFGKQLVAGTGLLLQWRTEQVVSKPQSRKRTRGATTVACTTHQVKTFHGKLAEGYVHPAHVVQYDQQPEARVDNYNPTSPWVSTDKTDEDEHKVNLATLETDLSGNEDGKSVATGNSADTFYLQSWVLASYACYEFIHAQSGLGLTILDNKKIK